MQLLKSLLISGGVAPRFVRCELSDTLTQPNPQNNLLPDTTLVSALQGSGESVKGQRAQQIPAHPAFQLA